MTETIIRPAKESDLAPLAALGAKFYRHAKAWEFGLGFSMSDAAGTLESLIDNPDAALIVAVQDGRPVGMIGGLIGTWFVERSQRILTELFWWLDASARMNGTARKLYEAFEDQGRKKNARFLALIAMRGEDERLLDVYYRRWLNMKYVESHYLKEI